VRKLEDHIEAVLPPDGEVVAQETSQGVRTIHVYADGTTPTRDAVSSRGRVLPAVEGEGGHHVRSRLRTRRTFASLTRTAPSQDDTYGRRLRRRDYVARPERVGQFGRAEEVLVAVQRVSERATGFAQDNLPKPRPDAQPHGCLTRLDPGLR
jgi:hypothetical protein